jgi:hypothetical protein
MASVYSARAKKELTDRRAATEIADLVDDFMSTAQQCLVEIEDAACPDQLARIFDLETYKLALPAQRLERIRESFHGLRWRFEEARIAVFGSEQAAQAAEQLEAQKREAERQRHQEEHRERLREWLADAEAKAVARDRERSPN